ncbi:MAG: chemotaxis protein CheB [Desulfamplus sp.]|nr:chemotaxis protein CheB [Desulfamplus sp.]MBF0412273.1 chemotaxis protein CheB [Desulfamplus sp.]
MASQIKRPALKAVVIGVSAGGFKALHRILPMFRRDFELPVMVVQHRRADLESYLVESLNDRCQMSVKEPLDKTKIESGTIYIAPGGYHLLVEKDIADGCLYFALSVDPPVCYCRPSIDVLFESAAEVFGPSLLGVILTGANFDGSNGIKKIKSLGGITIAENPETAEVDYMPSYAIRTNAVDHIMNLDEIPCFIETIMKRVDGESE